MWVAVSSPTWSDLELGDYAERYLIDCFFKCKKCWKNSRVGGLRELSVRVWIDPIKLAANNLTIQEVERAFRNENVIFLQGH
jgi:HAE1 family hydrophobic/amphiphilic exporter-1/multidrug efflux pump